MIATMDITERQMVFMREAIQLSSKGMHLNEGGPFGCVIVRNDEIIGRGNNKVIALNDPTAHAEIMAIRDACRQINFFQLDQCELYTSCEPCPMCLGAIYWARIQNIYYACTRKDAAMIGFDDDFIYQEINKSMQVRAIPLQQMLQDEGLSVFGEWELKPDKIAY